MLIAEETMEDQTVPDGLRVVPTPTSVGALPGQVINDQTTSQHDICCEGCGRPPGPVAVQGVPLFDLGVKHCLNRLAKLIASVPGMSQGEANAIVLKLTRDDVEL